MQQDLSNWIPRERPSPITLDGRSVRLETYVQERHCAPLWLALGGDDGANDLMRYFPNSTFGGADDFAQWLAYENDSGSYQTMVFIDKACDEIVGMANYMRIDAANGVIEVGAVAHGQAMARSTMATEAHYLMARYVFETLGYRRYEWKLNNDNQPSHSAAKRLGFQYEGVFRNHMVAKGVNRDTAWYAMVDNDWPKIKVAFEAWLSPENFNKGQQIRRLEDLRVEMGQ